jgi:hemerythrin-like domain-containing protein
MNTRARDLNGGDCLSPTTLLRPGNPLDFIHWDHLRERQICGVLDRIATDAAPDRDDLEHVREYLARELPLHLEDEEEDLFPLLRQACEPEDEIGKAIERLTADHHHAAEDTPRLLADLDALLSWGGAPDKEMRDRFRRFAAQARRHLILENAIILPFARLRLTGRDLESLCLGMAQRRGLDRLPQLNTAD